MRPQAATELTVTERAELGRYEAVIGRGLATFMDVARALIAIREGKLYRGTHATFEDYCNERWDISQSHAYRLIDATAVIDNLKAHQIGELPARESQVRPLASLEPDQQVAAWNKAKEVAAGHTPTAAQVQQAADTIKPPAKVRYLVPPIPDEPEPADAPSDEELDAVAEVDAERVTENEQRAEREAARAEKVKAAWADTSTTLSASVRQMQQEVEDLERLAMEIDALSPTVTLTLPRALAEKWHTILGTPGLPPPFTGADAYVLEQVLWEALSEKGMK